MTIRRAVVNDMGCRVVLIHDVAEALVHELGGLSKTLDNVLGLRCVSFYVLVVSACTSGVIIIILEV